MLVFGICWAPFHADRLMWSFIIDWTDSYLKIFQYVHIISGVFFYLSSAVNPILYNLMSTRFREMFKEVMCHRPHHINHRKHSLSVTRMTLRSTLSDVPLSNGAVVVEAEAEDGEIRMKDETSLTWSRIEWCWKACPTVSQCLRQLSSTLWTGVSDKYLKWPDWKYVTMLSHTKYFHFF